jgi:hypothetical protein
MPPTIPHDLHAKSRIQIPHSSFLTPHFFFSLDKEVLKI